MICYKAEQFLEKKHTSLPDIQYSSILLAVDGSAPAVQASLHAMKLAKEMKAVVTAVFVDDDGENALIEEPDWPFYATEERVRHGIAGIHFAKMIAEEAGVAFNGVLLRGSLTHQIISLAQEIKAQMIVVGDKGLSGIKRTLLGSIAEEVVQSSFVPVLVVKAKYN